MKRSLTKLGNKSFSITVPKNWVERNRLEPRTDLEVIDNGNKLIISAHPEKSVSEREIVLKNYCDDSFFSLVTSLYNEGHSKIILTYDNSCIFNLDKIDNFLNGLQGITYERTINSIIIYEHSEKRKCDDLIVKCFQNISYMVQLLDSPKKDNDWYISIYEGYQRIFFSSEYIFRLLHIEQAADTNNAFRNFGAAWSLQCIAFLIKRMAELEMDFIKKHSKMNMFDFSALFRSVNETIFKKGVVNEYYTKKKLFEDKIKLISDSVFQENAHMFSFLCTKLVKLFAPKGVTPVYPI